MLVLSRHIGESVYIDVAGHRITVTLVDVKNSNKCRLGFEGGPDVTFVREEIDGMPPKPGRPRFGGIDTP